LHYDGTYAEVVPPYSRHVIPGDFLGDSSQVVFFSPELAGDSVNVGISRKAGDTNVRGHGTVARVKFRTSSDTPNGTRLCFTLASVTANDSVWNPIELTPGDTCIWIINQVDTVLVWPGDTNNDGVANQADVLPIGLAWNLTGPVRPNASINWDGQPCPVWTPERVTYVDATGDGIVNIADVNPIGPNWGRTHTLGKSFFLPALVSMSNGRLCPIVEYSNNGNEEFYVDIQVQDVHDLFGIAFELRYAQDTFDIVSVDAGKEWSSDRLYYRNNDDSNGILGLAITQKAGQEGLDGMCTMARISMRTKYEFDDKDLNFDLTQVVANNSSGEVLTLAADQAILSNDSDNLPKQFSLHQNYPNPFNASTTIKYELPVAGKVEVKIYDALGNEVAVLVDENKSSGVYKCVWDGRDRFGDEISSGIYFYKIATKSFTAIKKCVFIK